MGLWKQSWAELTPHWKWPWVGLYWTRDISWLWGLPRLSQNHPRSHISLCAHVFSNVVVHNRINRFDSTIDSGIWYNGCDHLWCNFDGCERLKAVSCGQATLAAKCFAEVVASTRVSWQKAGAKKRQIILGHTKVTAATTHYVYMYLPNRMWLHRTSFVYTILIINCLITYRILDLLCTLYYISFLHILRFKTQCIYIS